MPRGLLLLNNENGISCAKTLNDGICRQVRSPKEFGDKSVIKEVLDGDPHTDTKKLSGNANVKEKVQKKRVKGDPTMTLIPSLCDKKSIEYEVKYKGTSKPFSKVRVILRHELKEKGEAAVKGLLCRVLKLNINGTTCPLKRAAVPGDHLTIEHPKVLWSAHSSQVWSCIGWEMDQLEQKRQKTVQFGDFHAEQSSGATPCACSSGRDF
ncbi:hypothetical protein F2Q68_00010929 [Brassica cretica]|uniref:Uncharacterized protein n=1 Tax=Brassica cretica TaxID=69181 RepID=A0A8S9L4E1_BRACR|nr:hypothetical protein F2Q68_00010929 [Brassica cretica]